MITPTHISTSGGLITAAFIENVRGVGRAPAMAAAYLISTGKTADEAWQMIREKRPFILPRAGQVAQVARFAAEMGD